MYRCLHATPDKLLLVWWSVLLLLIDHMSKQCVYLCIIYGDFVVYEVLHMSCLWTEIAGWTFLLVGTLIKMNESRHLQLLFQNKGISFRSNNLVLTFLQLSLPVDNNWMVVP